jgi:hypothetical protein
MHRLALSCSLGLITAGMGVTSLLGSVEGEAANAPGEYAAVTTGCPTLATNGEIVVTIYGAPVGSLIGYETLNGPDVYPGESVINKQFAASQFHVGQPVPMSLEVAQAQQTYTVNFNWTDGSGVAHSMSPTIVSVPNCTGAQYISDPYPQLSYINLLPTASGDGYYLLSGSGLVNALGGQDDYGDTYSSDENLSNTLLNAPVIGMARGPTSEFGGTEGYWIATADGGVFTFGGFTSFYGSAGSLHLKSPIVGIASTNSGNGYWLVAADGGIFSYGAAQFYGSTGAMNLNSPIVGMAPTPDDGGYYLVAADGGVFAYGDAQFQGSMGGMHLNQPVVGMGVDQATGGYWLAASDGGIFAYDAPFHGSTGSIHLNQPIVSFAPTPSGNGYWFMGVDGGMFSYGDAQYFGSGVSSGAS